MAIGENITNKSVENTIETEKGSENPEESPFYDDWVDDEDEKVVPKELFCVFTINQVEYAIPIKAVKEVVRYSNLAPVPEVPGYILGVSNVRGNIFAVLDLGKYFEANSEGKYIYLMVLNHDEYRLAVALPGVPDTLSVSEDMIEELSSSSVKMIKRREYLKSVIKYEKRMIIELNIFGLIANENFATARDQQ